MNLNMMNWIVNLVVFSLITCDSHGESKYEIKLDSHLTHLQKMRQPYQTFNHNRMQARDYIRETFESYNLTTTSQEFKTKMALENSISEVIGWNVLAETRNPDKNAPVLLIGTYYDNTGQWNPWMESGASVAAMLETARIFQTLMQSQDPQKDAKGAISVVFVAFDLNIKKYDPFVTNSPTGSEIFVKKWLNASWENRQVLGAVLLDSIAAFNEDKNTQIVSQHVKEFSPTAFAKIQKGGFRGNFLSLTYNFSHLDFTHGFYQTFKQASVGTPIKLVSMAVPSSSDIERHPLWDLTWSTPLFDFWREKSFPTILLSDWAKGRTDAFARQKSVLGREDFMKSKQRNFVETTTKALINLLVRFSRGTIPSGDKPDIPTPKLPDSSSSKLKIEAILYVISLTILVLQCRSL